PQTDVWQFAKLPPTSADGTGRNEACETHSLSPGVTGNVLGQETPMSIHPQPQQLQDLAASTDRGPILMLNLLRFKADADGIDEGVTGAEAYARYSVATEPFLRAVGGRLFRPRRAALSVPAQERPLASGTSSLESLGAGASESARGRLNGSSPP